MTITKKLIITSMHTATKLIIMIINTATKQIMNMNTNTNTYTNTNTNTVMNPAINASTAMTIPTITKMIYAAFIKLSYAG